MPSLSPNLRYHEHRTGQLLQICAAMQNTTDVQHWTHRKLIAEIALLRLFSLFEDTISAACLKLLCGATYLDGSSPSLLVRRAYSMEKALQLCEQHARNSTKRYHARWSKASDIRENMRYVMSPNEHIVDTVRKHGIVINDIRVVRNHIAHGSRDSRKKYNSVIEQYYGAVSSVPPGTFLLTKRFVSRDRDCPLGRFIAQQRALLKIALKA